MPERLLQSFFCNDAAVNTQADRAGSRQTRNVVFNDITLLPAWFAIQPILQRQKIIAPVSKKVIGNHLVLSVWIKFLIAYSHGFERKIPGVALGE